jgi:hypothetical protein
MFQITTKLELNVLGNLPATEYNGVLTFAIRNKIPAIVTDPLLIEQMFVQRSRYNGQFKIICALDFRGGDFAVSKFQHIPKIALDADGFDVYLTPKKSDIESSNEMKAIEEFISRINMTAEKRWTLGLRTGDGHKNTLRHFKERPANYIRNDINLISPLATLETLKKDVELIRSHSATPIKLCGNIDLDIIDTLKTARYDVTLTQARGIVNEVKAREKRLKENPQLVEPQKENLNEDSNNRD